jgi:hypothetical protein
LHQREKRRPSRSRNFKSASNWNTDSSVKAGGYEKLGHLETYTQVVVSRGGKEVFKDRSLTQYAFSHKSYPKMMSVG